MTSSTSAVAQSNAVNFLEGLMEGFVAYDARWRVSYVNAAAERLLKRTRAELLDLAFLEAFPASRGTLFQEQYERVMRERVATRFESFHPHYGGWFEVSVSPVADGGIAVYFRDITERKRIESALQRSERNLSDFFDNAAVGLHWVGPDGTILRANQAELDMLGYARDEYVGRSIAEFHVDRDTIENILSCLSNRETLHNREARLRCKDGSIKDVLISSNVLFEDDKFVHTRCFTRDVTARKRAEDALREADRRKDEFLATLAHELRNPLAPLRNGLHLLRLTDRDSDAAEQARAMMERQLAHMVRLVDDLMEISRISSGKVELRKDTVELASVVGSAVETSRPLIEAGGHALEIDLPVAPITVHADAMRLAQVLSNLLNNAAKYTESGGRIRLAVRAEGAEAAISVSDNGVGIPQEMLPGLFEMFSQIDRTLQRAQGGLGIGLALAKRLVQLHGGRIDASSAGPGRGSEFTIRLPAAAAPRMPIPARADVAAGARRRRVLVVDDNADAARSLAMLLEHMGHEVQVAFDGGNALRIASRQRPEIVLLDISMPDMDGHGVASAMRADPDLRHTLVVAVTGLGQEEDRRRSREAGFDAHLVKPVAPDKLQELLAAH